MVVFPVFVTGVNVHRCIMTTECKKIIIDLELLDEQVENAYDIVYGIMSKLNSRYTISNIREILGEDLYYDIVSFLD